MSRIVFLVEEQSMKELLMKIVPRAVGSDVDYLIIPHEGKADLDKSIPRKLRAFPRGDRFVFCATKTVPIV
jgi:hypothetical protein